MMTGIPIRVMVCLAVLLWGSNLYAFYEELGVEENNPFGGRSLLFRQLDEGVLRGKNSYDAAGKLMREERSYSEEWANVHGTQRLVDDYLFEIKVKEKRTYARSIAVRHQVRIRTTFYEQATGTKVREENQFVRAYLGNNKIYFELGVKKRMEWFYPANKEGYQQVNTSYDSSGKVLKIESLYTKKSVKFEGCIKKVVYFSGLKKAKEEWWFSPAYAKANNRAVRKLKVYFDNPSHPKAPETYYFDPEDEVVTPNHPYED